SKAEYFAFSNIKADRFHRIKVTIVGDVVHAQLSDLDDRLAVKGVT
ncbi:hypothetical protein D043_1105B, partial [Vibrio parahaemolyticus EKP-021]